MNLIQISEPETPKVKALDEFAIGIDLGTTNSVVACVINGKATILGPITPSIVTYSDDGYMVGKPGGISSVKRLMSGDASIKLNQYTPIEISSHILAHLKAQAEEYLGAKVSKAVITVPAHFDDAARHATKAAANLAGLEVLRLINEPTAAAMAYGLDHQAEGIYLIYDFGGGTFDVSILNMQKAVFQVLATGGDVNLGGDDIDQSMNIANLKLAKEIKERLTIEESVEIAGVSFTKEKFEEIAKPFIEKTIQICLATINESKIDLSQLKEVILVGGGTRIPLVKQMITAAIKVPLDNIDPDLVVAMGAAIQADSLLHGSDNLLLDVTSLSIGLEVMGGTNERIITKNSTIPLSVTKHFTTYQDGQTGIVFHIIQGEREMVRDCRSLAKFELKNIPPMRAGAAKVAVTFSVDGDGLLTVSAYEENSGVKQEILVKPSYGLSAEEVEKMLEQAYMNAAVDLAAKQLAEAKFASQTNILNLTQAMQEDAEFLTAANKQYLLEAIARLKEALNGNILNEIEQANSSFESESSSFIQDRLNRQIKMILQGQSTNNFN